jgi:hypothetical protein
MTTPRDLTPAGYAWLIERYGLRVPEPARSVAISDRHRREDLGDLLVLTPRHRPDDTLSDHVHFALKWEGVNAGALKALAGVAPTADLEGAVRDSPHGKYSRRFWFLVEWLTGRTLDVEDLPARRGAVPVVDPSLQFAPASGELSERHRVRNNLPGTPDFCPMVRRTPGLDRLAKRDLATEMRRVAGRIHPDLLARAAAFMLLADSRASFDIESERPAKDRVQRWAEAIAEAAEPGLDIERLESLQRRLMPDARFVKIGLRTEGGFVGSRDRLSGAPLPEHVSARSDDLPSLLGGLTAFLERAVESGLEPVVAAASVAFGFVYVHPFEDGNGRIHRWIIHHALAATGFTPAGLVLPVSSVMLDEIEAYRDVLRSRSGPMLRVIDWRPTPEGNVEVLGETADAYRYLDLTAHAEFLYRCVERAVDEDLPREVDFLRGYDRFMDGLEEIVDMPPRTADLLHRFLSQNEGTLSRRARTNEFAPLTDGEVEAIERLYVQAHGL